MKEIIPNILVKIERKYYETTDISLDEPPCMECHKLIKDVPLRLWTSPAHNTRELHFCFDCAVKLGLLDNK